MEPDSPTLSSTTSPVLQEAARSSACSQPWMPWVHTTRLSVHTHGYRRWGIDKDTDTYSAHAHTYYMLFALTNTHVLVRTYMHACMHAFTRSYIHTCIHAYASAFIVTTHFNTHIPAMMHADSSPRHRPDLHTYVHKV